MFFSEISIISSHEVEKYVEEIQPFTIKEIGSAKYVFILFLFYLNIRV